MAIQFNEQSEQEIEKYLKRYPTKKAALLPVFHIAQRQFGWISQEVMELIAKRLELPLAHVYGVATFYTMLNKKPVGRHHLQVCRTLPCALMGYGNVIKYLKEKLGIQEGETTKDKKFTLTTVECLASCDTGPMMMVNEKYCESLTPAKIDEILDGLK